LESTLGRGGGLTALRIPTITAKEREEGKGEGLKKKEGGEVELTMDLLSTQIRIDNPKTTNQGSNAMAAPVGSDSHCNETAWLRGVKKKMF